MTLSNESAPATHIDINGAALGAAALWYAEHGIPVFPLYEPIEGGCSCGKNTGAVADCDVCRSAGKHPRIASGFKSASAEPKVVAAWWDRWPQANIGIPTGSLTGLIVVDSDPRNGGPADREGLIELVGSLPETAEVRTGGDGRHSIFRYGGGAVPKQLFKGVDLKGEGGYVVAPPSLHESGKRYEWDCSDGAEAILHPAEAPQWLLAWITERPKGTTSGTPGAAGEAGGKVGAGHRHNHLVSLAGRMRRGGMSLEAIEAALVVENQSACDPPKPEREVRQIARSMERYAPGDRNCGTPEPWPDIIPLESIVIDPIPADALPSPLREMVVAVSECMETPIELAALLGLAVVAASVAGKADVSPEPGYTEPLNLYVCPAMESGNRKTAVFTRLIAPLVEYERQETERMRPAHALTLSKSRTIAAQVAHLRKKAASAKNMDRGGLLDQIQELEQSMPEVPVVPRLFCDDVTPERLAGMMQEQRGRIAVLSDEGGIFDILAGRYSKGVPNLDLWLKAHAASPVRVDRQDPNKSPVSIDKPHLTVAISPQPDVLAKLRDKPGFRGRGLIARFLFALPPSRLGYRFLTVRPVPSAVEERYAAAIRSLLAYAPDETVHLHFTPEAYLIWKEFQRRIEYQFRPGGRLAQLKDWGSKLPGAAARVAGVMHMFACANHTVMATEIEAATMESAVEVATSLISHCRAALALMDEDPAFRHAQQVLAWIIQQGTESFSVRDCFRAHQTLFKRVSEITPIFTVLEQHGYIRICRQPSSGGRPPSPRCEVNPTLRGGNDE